MRSSSSSTRSARRSPISSRGWRRMPDPNADLHSETTAIRTGRTYNDASLAPVLWPSTTYFNQSVDEQFAMARAAHPGKFYSRNGSPTVLELEDAVAALEGAE